MDFSGLNQITALFSALFNVLFPVFILLFVFGIIMVLIPASKKFLKGFTVVGDSNSLVKPKRTKKVMYAIFGIFALLLLILSSFTAQVNGADGANGSINCGGVTSIAGGSPVTITAENLDASSTYAINWTGHDTCHNFTTGADQSTYYISTTIQKPTTGNDVIIYLRKQTTQAIITSCTLYVQTVDDLIPSDFLLSIAIAVLVVMIVVGLAVGIGYTIYKKTR